MATASKAIRLDDLTGLNVRTFTITEAAETRHIQSVAVSDGDDGAPLDIVGEGALEKGVLVYGHDGTVPRAITTDAAGDLQVDVATLPANASVNVNQYGGSATTLGQKTMAASEPVAIASDQTAVPVSGTITANQGVPPWTMEGDIDHDAVDAAGNNPIKVGFKAKAFGSNPTAVADADRTHGYANRHGIPFVIGGHPNPFTEESVFTAAQTDVSLKTIATGTKIAITRACVTVDKANSVDVGYRMGFAAVTLPATGTGVAGILSSHPGLAAGSGVVEGDGGGLLGVGADDQDLRFTCEVPTGGSIRVVVTGFTIES